MIKKGEKVINLQSRIIIALLGVSLLPIILVGFGGWIVFGRLLDKKALELQLSVVQSHASSIETYLEGLLSSLQLLVDTSDLDELSDPVRLADVFHDLNRNNDSAFEDLGIIGPDGTHLAYVGPYELLNRNYQSSDWFIQAMSEGTYISDVFLGFRQVPHCIIAVKASDDEAPWILRGTIDSQRFDVLVHRSALGESGDIFIVNREGIYQTASRSGHVLDHSGIGRLESFSDVNIRTIRQNGSKLLQVTTWINSDKWLLVAEQDAAAVRAPVNRAIAAGSVVLMIAFLLIAITTFVATRLLTTQIDKANERREEAVKAFMRSAKLASIGELAAGLAHEINNPLAVISADQTNISDIVLDLDIDDHCISMIQESLMRCKRQVERCKNITTKMLQFSRRSDVELKPKDITSNLNDCVSLMERQAKTRNINLTLEVEPNLPLLELDALELEQVIVNLINNSMQAMQGGGNLKITTRQNSDGVVIEVIDDGTGIRPADLERIFEPFFTTKPVGEGTGLGLSVCYGIVESWGGMITAESTVGIGTTIRIRIPK